MTGPQTYNPAGVDLAVAALAQIEMHPETWNQDTWRCSTGMCLAGWMAQLSPEVEWRNAYIFDHLDHLLTNGQAVGVWAMDFIGLPANGVALFEADNTMDDLRVGVKALCNNEPVLDAIVRDRAERAK